MTSPNGDSSFIMSSVQDFDFGVWADALQLGLGLNGHGLAKAGRDGARFLNHRDNGGGLGDAENAARLAGVLHNVTGAECVNVGHKFSLVVKSAACAVSALRRAWSASARSRAMRSPSIPV